MVLRLFVPPGEGQHLISPKRPDPLGANATPQYAIIGSTAAAAGYVSLVRRVGPRLGAPAGLSVPAVFLKTAGRAGVYAAVLGAAVNCFYHYDFTSQVYEASKVTPTPFRLYAKTDRYTVDDACLAGAGVGLLAGLSLYRMRLSWWRRAMGMANVGACGGLAAAHGYFHYTGERQKAAAELKEQRQKRYLQFHLIYWNKLLMSGFSPPTQAYVTCTGVFHAKLLPQESYDFAEKPAKNQGASSESSQTPVATTEEPVASYYREPIDHSENLKQIGVDLTLGKLEEMEADRQALLNEAEYVVALFTQKQFEFCHTEFPDDYERKRKMREMQLLLVTFNKLRSDADEVDRTMYLWRNDLKQKAAWESADASHDTMPAWIPKLARCDPDSHVPTTAITKFTEYQDQLTKNIREFEDIASNPIYTDESRKKARDDLEDARILLKAADFVHYELERKARTDPIVSRATEADVAGVGNASGKEEAEVEHAKSGAKETEEVEKEQLKAKEAERGSKTGAEETSGGGDGREPSSP
ncbi:hypothetical protein P154DRAFT_522906 [Amniculicola lignicola CBS 123094]|uniref:Uncharacterized protein n=1 Tax=Amniculicola lignicola CBS 123094 TaxID=1392246 RepID=A0A6A5WFC4_9PLEO|nr:hypothetical protein P154DRAFT_522906 [Amniculicola lignicola CBS 123094]